MTQGRAAVLAAAWVALTMPALLLAQGASPTYTRDVAPIVFAKCARCHHPGSAAPFSVLSYQSIRPFATQVALLTARGDMPPWKAEPAPGGFVGQERLTAGEIETLQQWVRGGAPEGSAADLPPVPAWRDEWRVGTPDLVIDTPHYQLRSEGTDVFRIFVVPIPVSSQKFVRGLEFRPGNPKAIHHANIRIDRTRASRRFDEADPEPGYEGLLAHSATYPDGYFLAWTPGQVSPLLPKGLGWRLEPDTDLVVELHMQPSGKVEDVNASIGLYFTDDPPERTPAMLRLGRQNLDMAPGESAYIVTDSFVLPVDVEVQAVQPHAHYRANYVSGTATLPDGSTRSLIEIKQWDFRWQHVFRYVQPIALPRGTTIAMKYVFDNSAENPRNPVQPPRRVYWGQKSADEMADLWLQVLTKSDADLDLLNAQFGEKVMAEDVIGYERWIQAEPTSAALHDDAGILYLKLNRANDAVRHFAISAAFQPELPAAHFNLALALTVAGQVPAAVREYQRALELKPDYALAHANLGSVLLRAGLLGDAVRHLEEAIRLDPDNTQAHYNMASARALQGRQGEALDSYRRALALSPDQPQMLMEMAWLLAATRDVSLRDSALAVTLAERAATLTGRKNPAALDTLAVAYAAAGYFSKAAEVAGQALALGPANADDIRARRTLYERMEPYRLPAPVQSAPR